MPMAWRCMIGMLNAPAGWPPSYSGDGADVDIDRTRIAFEPFLRLSWTNVFDSSRYLISI